MHDEATHVGEAPYAASLDALAEGIARGMIDAQVLARRPGRVTVRAESASGPVIVKL